MDKRQDLDCAVLSHDNKKYIFPMIVLSQIVRINDAPMSSLNSQNNGSLQILTWKSTPIPLVTLDLTPFMVTHKDHEKIAIVNALYSEESSRPPYFALYFTGPSVRIKMSEHSIQWTDQEGKLARVNHNGMLIDVTVLDLFYYSSMIESQIQDVEK